MCLVYGRVKNKQVTLVQLIPDILKLPYKIEVTPEYRRRKVLTPNVHKLVKKNLKNLSYEL